ncbi:unnamed protein product [Closterium sp. NIES-65]|nr:unnamed protein product [Closterium sp. NIES-65]
MGAVVTGRVRGGRVRAAYGRKAVGCKAEGCAAYGRMAVGRRTDGVGARVSAASARLLGQPQAATPNPIVVQIEVMMGRMGNEYGNKTGTGATGAWCGGEWRMVWGQLAHGAEANGAWCGGNWRMVRRRMAHGVGATGAWCGGEWRTADECAADGCGASGDGWLPRLHVCWDNHRLQWRNPLPFFTGCCAGGVVVAVTAFCLFLVVYGSCWGLVKREAVMKPGKLMLKLQLRSKQVGVSWLVAATSSFWDASGAVWYYAVAGVAERFKQQQKGDIFPAISPSGVGVLALGSFGIPTWSKLVLCGAAWWAGVRVATEVQRGGLEAGCSEQRQSAGLLNRLLVSAGVLVLPTSLGCSAVLCGGAEVARCFKQRQQAGLLNRLAVSEGVLVLPAFRSGAVWCCVAGQAASWDVTHVRNSPAFKRRGAAARRGSAAGKRGGAAGKRGGAAGKRGGAAGKRGGAAGKRGGAAGKRGGAAIMRDGAAIMRGGAVTGAGAAAMRGVGGMLQRAADVRNSMQDGMLWMGVGEVRGNGRAEVAWYLVGGEAGRAGGGAGRAGVRGSGKRVEGSGCDLQHAATWCFLVAIRNEEKLARLLHVLEVCGGSMCDLFMCVCGGDVHVMCGWVHVGGVGMIVIWGCICAICINPPICIYINPSVSVSTTLHLHQPSIYINLPSASTSICINFRLHQLPSASTSVCINFRLHQLPSASTSVCINFRLHQLPSASTSVCINFRLHQLPSASTSVCINFRLHQLPSASTSVCINFPCALLMTPRPYSPSSRPYSSPLSRPYSSPPSRPYSSPTSRPCSSPPSRPCSPPPSRPCSPPRRCFPLPHSPST